MSKTPITPSLSREKMPIVLRGWNAFWADGGWAPKEASDILRSARLDWQASLADCLQIWTAERVAEIGPGAMILAWANLGSILESSLKFFFSVFYLDYKSDINNIRTKEGELIPPDKLKLEHLKVFARGRLWDKKSPFDATTETIQTRRNAIHSYVDREIGDFNEFEHQVVSVYRMFHEMESRIQYPDEGPIPEDTHKMFEDGFMWASLKEEPYGN